MNRSEENASSPANQAAAGQGSERGISPAQLLSGFKWDTLSISWLADASSRLEALSWVMSRAGIVPAELAPLLAMKAVENSRLDGHEIELLDVYKTERLLAAHAKPSLQHQLVYNHFQMLQVPPIGNLPDVAALLDLYGKLMTRIIPSEEVIYRQGSKVHPSPLLPMPPAKYIEEALAEIVTFAAEAEQIHPLVKLALVYAQLTSLQPFPIANTAFSLLAVDRMLQAWRYMPLPALNLASYLRASGTRYPDCLKAFQQVEGLNDWLGFFFEGLWHAADDAVEIFTLHQLFGENLEDRLSVLLGVAIPGGLARFFMRQPAFTRQQFEWRIPLPEEDISTVLQALLKSGQVQIIHLPGGEALYYVPDVLTWWETMGQEPEVR